MSIATSEFVGLEDIYISFQDYSISTISIAFSIIAFSFIIAFIIAFSIAIALESVFIVAVPSVTLRYNAFKEKCYSSRESSVFTYLLHDVFVINVTNDVINYDNVIRIHS